MLTLYTHKRPKLLWRTLKMGTVLMYNSHACRRVYDVKTVFKLSLILTVAAGSFSSRKQQEFRFVWYSVCAFELLWACAFSVCLCEKMYRCVLSKKGTYVEHLPFLWGGPAQTPLMQMTFHSKGHIRRNFQHLKIGFCFRLPLLSWSCPLCRLGAGFLCVLLKSVKLLCSKCLFITVRHAS